VNVLDSKNREYMDVTGKTMGSKTIIPEIGPDSFNETLRQKGIEDMNRQEDLTPEQKIDNDKFREASEQSRLEWDRQCDIAGASEEFKKLYQEYMKLGEQINNLLNYGDVKQQNKTIQLKEKAGELFAKMITLPFKGYSLEFVPVLSYVSVANPDHRIERSKDGHWKTIGFEENLAITIGENGLPVKAVGKKHLVRIFNKPQEVDEEHLITFTTQEEIELKEANRKSEAKKNIKPIPTYPEAWICSRCNTNNFYELELCRGCNSPKATSEKIMNKDKVSTIGKIIGLTEKKP
jgi:hypothetical protein